MTLSEDSFRCQRKRDVCVRWMYAWFVRDNKRDDFFGKLHCNPCFIALTNMFNPSSSLHSSSATQKSEKEASMLRPHVFILLAPNALPLCGSNIKHNNLHVLWSIYAETSSSFHAKCFNIFNQFYGCCSYIVSSCRNLITKKLSFC